MIFGQNGFLEGYHGLPKGALLILSILQTPIFGGWAAATAGASLAGQSSGANACRLLKKRANTVGRGFGEPAHNPQEPRTGMRHTDEPHHAGIGG